MNDKTTAIIIFKYKFGEARRLATDVTALINQMQEIEDKFEESDMEINYESMWKSLKEILKNGVEKNTNK